MRWHLDFLCKKKDIETIALALVSQNKVLSAKPMTKIKDIRSSSFYSYEVLQIDEYVRSVVYNIKERKFHVLFH
jgi:hypothetical protein